MISDIMGIFETITIVEHMFSTAEMMRESIFLNGKMM